MGWKKVTVTEKKKKSPLSDERAVTEFVKRDERDAEAPKYKNVNPDRYTVQQGDGTSFEEAVGLLDHLPEAPEPVEVENDEEWAENEDGEEDEPAFPNSYTFSLDRNFVKPLVEDWLANSKFQTRFPKTKEELLQSQPWSKADTQHATKLYGRLHGTAISELMEQLVGQQRQRLESGSPETDPYTVNTNLPGLHHIFSVANVISRPNTSESDDVLQSSARSVLQQLSGLHPKASNGNFWKNFLQQYPYKPARKFNVNDNNAWDSATIPIPRDRPTSIKGDGM